MANYNYQGSFLQKTNCNDQEKTRLLTAKVIEADQKKTNIIIARGYTNISGEHRHLYY